MISSVLAGDIEAIIAIELYRRRARHTRNYLLMSARPSDMLDDAAVCHRAVVLSFSAFFPSKIITPQTAETTRHFISRTKMKRIGRAAAVAAAGLKIMVVRRALMMAWHG